MWRRLWPLAFAAALRAQSPEEWVERLGSPRHPEREEAEQALWRMGDEALPLLRQAAGSDDPEVAQRARRVVKKLEDGVYADTPPELAALIQNLASLPVQDRVKVAASNLTDRVLGPRLLRRAAQSALAKREGPRFSQAARLALRKPLRDMADAGREAEAARLLEMLARLGLPDFAPVAARAAWFTGTGTAQLERLGTEAAQPGDARLKAHALFQQERFGEGGEAAIQADEPRLAALCSALQGNWDPLDLIPGLDDFRPRGDLDFHRLAIARLTGRQEDARIAAREILAFAEDPNRGQRQDAWFGLELLLLNDAWPALPAFFAACSNSVFEAEYAWEFFQPDRLVRAARPAWEQMQTPPLRSMLLKWTWNLTGKYPTDNRGEVRVARQFGEEPSASAPAADPAENSWESIRANLELRLQDQPDQPNTLLMMGWVESRLGHAEAAAAWRKMAGWRILLGTPFEASTLQPVILRYAEDAYWTEAVELIHRLCPEQAEFLPYLERVFRDAYAGRIEAGVAIGWLEIGRLRFLSPARSYQGMQGYLSIARQLAELHMLYALRSQKPDAARALMEAHRDLLLHEAAEVHRRLTEAGHAEFARVYVRDAIETMMKRLRPYPAAVGGRNEAAWTAAVSRELLAEALELLEAAEVEGAWPADALDTRAELLFQLGRDAEALTLAEKNAAQDPDDAYLKRQIERMRRGDRQSRPQ